MRPAWLSRRIGLLICAHLVSILSKEVVRQEKKKPSCLVKSLLSGNHQKSIFNSAVCVRAPLNPRLYNPPRQPSLSCANKHVTDPKRGEEASVRPQSFPDGTRRRHYLHRPDLVPKVTRLERLPRDPAGFFLP